MSAACACHFFLQHRRRLLDLSQGTLRPDIRSTNLYHPPYAGAPDRRNSATYWYGCWLAGRCASAAAAPRCPRPDGLGYGDGVPPERHAGVRRNDIHKARRRIQRRQAPDHAELRCRGRHSIGRHACRDRGGPGAGRRCVRRRVGNRGPDLRPGGISRELWQYLPYFSEITYSLPLSVASVNQARYDGLSSDLREAVDAAGRQTETELWLALSTRLQENYQRMRQSGVTIDSHDTPALVEAFQPGAAAAQRVWCTESGPVCHQILDAYKAGRP